MCIPDYLLLIRQNSIQPHFPYSKMVFINFNIVEMLILEGFIPVQFRQGHSPQRKSGELNGHLSEGVMAFEEACLGYC